MRRHFGEGAMFLVRLAWAVAVLPLLVIAFVLARQHLRWDPS